MHCHVLRPESIAKRSFKKLGQLSVLVVVKTTLEFFAKICSELVVPLNDYQLFNKNAALWTLA
jgi:hypothetical protein